jgi:hypothetical protein
MRSGLHPRLLNPKLAARLPRRAAIARALNLCLTIVLALCAEGASPGRAADAARIHLTPRFSPGEVVRYEIDLRNVSKGHAEGPIREPEEASELKQSATIVIRLEVLSVDPQPATGLSKIRIRATYERSAANNESDAYDEQADAMVEQFRKLEGQSVEFTLGGDGRISDVTGFEKIFHDPSAIANARGWISNITPGAGFPKKGIVVGEKWHFEEPLAGSPLKGTVWRTDSSYLRNEPCHATAGAPTADAAAPPAATNDTETCAVVLTQFKILQTNPHGDLTPPDFVHNGLRTSGSWTGSGESLNSISLRTGLVMNVTQTSDQQMNFTISSSSSPSRMTYAGEVKSQSQIALLPDTSADSR